ncbi:MAG TPA: phenylalanine--tRNA ligase subunit beta, partial [Chloroflexota bacterium]|nr:phenylalanine--tRNA ligase subunit beta [Chloroflexota bacterium]
MRVPLKWLRDYVPLTVPAERISERLTLAGIEVAAVDQVGAWWDQIYVGEIVAVNPHPNADRLSLVTVDYGGRTRTVVTGAPNVEVGQKVPFALEGAELVDAHDPSHPRVRLKPAKIRGIVSEGMVCSELELGLGDEHAGILVLDSSARVGVPLVDELGDTILTLEVTPNRVDCLSLVGVAHEVAAIERVEVTHPYGTYDESGPDVHDLISVQIDAPDLCSRYAATVVDGITVGPSPRWLAERLTAAGIRPISNVVDVTNYVMLEWGQPLHAFDYDLLSGHQIIVRRASRGETIVSLDGQARQLAPETLVIADAERPVAIAGVMGGANTEVGSGTTRVLIESANFNPISIRRTSRSLRLPSEASRRFERGISPGLAPLALARATQLLVEVAGGQVARGMADCYPVPQRPTVIRLEPAEVERILGQAFSVDQMAAHLATLGFQTRPVESALEVTVPVHRVDVTIPADLAEEIARVIGYDNLPTSMPVGSVPPLTPSGAREMAELTRDVLVGCGLSEIITYSLTSPDRLGKLVARGANAVIDKDVAILVDRISPADSKPVELVNPQSSETTILRTSAWSHTLEIVRDNLRVLDRDVQVFEIGRVYLRREDGLPIERSVLTIGAGAYRTGRDWGSRVDLDFFDVKGYLEELFARLGIGDWSIRPAAHPTFQPGRAALIRARATADPDAWLPIAILGEVHQFVREAFDLNQRTFLAGIDLDRIGKDVLRRTESHQYISRYPVVSQDIALIVDATVLAQQIEQEIRTAGEPLLRAIQLFDVYEGERLGTGARSLAYHLSYQSPDRTLTDREVADVH